MSGQNMTLLDDYVLKFQKMEDEIITLKAENKVNKELIEYMEEIYKNFVLNFDALINGEKNEY
jgi:hypothetical protein